MKATAKGKRKQPFCAAREPPCLLVRAPKLAFVKRWTEEAQVAELKKKKRDFEYTWGKIIRFHVQRGHSNEVAGLLAKRERMERWMINVTM